MLISLSIPKDSVVLVNKDQKLDFQSPVFEKNIEKDLSINISEKLGINPKNIFRYMKKLVGAEIKKDEILAEKTGVFSSTKVLSPQEGLIREIDHNLGLVILTSKSIDKNKIFSPIKGLVEKVGKQDIEIKVVKGIEIEGKNNSFDFGGEIFYFDPERFTSAADISGRIIVAEKIQSFMQTKIEALGAKGFVTVEKLIEETDLPFAVIKDLSDFKKIKKSDFPYCASIASSDNIYFYS